MAFITGCWSCDVVLILLTLLLLLYLYMSYSHVYWRLRGVKSVPGTNIFGNFVDCILTRKPVRDVLRDFYLAGNGEKLIGFYVFDKPFLIIRSPELIKDVLVRDFQCFSNRCFAPNRHDYIGYVNIFSLKNPAWKVLRQKLSPVFTSSKLKSMFDSILEIGCDLDVYLKNTVRDDESVVVEMKEVCEKFTNDVIGLTMFGMKLNALNNPNAEFRDKGKKHFETSYTRYFSLLSLFFMPQLAKLFRINFFAPEVTTFFKRVINEATEERIKSGNKRNDLVDAFIDIKESYQNDPSDLSYYFQDDGLVATGIVFFLGGFEPSASMMYLVLYELAKQPHIQNRLRREILEAMDQTGGKITYDMIMSLPYLGMVTSEGLRKYPLLHFLDREAEEDYTFANTGVTIKKGTPIIIPMSGIHMDPVHFPDPEIFDPERFSAENKRNIIPFTYFPFGEGPRNCIGMRIGLVQAKVGLIHILSNYVVSPCEETPISLEYDSCTIFTKSLHNMKLKLRKVNDE